MLIVVLGHTQGFTFDTHLMILVLLSDVVKNLYFPLCGI